MAMSYLAILDEANAFELGGDLQAALDRWYLLEGMVPFQSTSKDGLSVTYDTEAVGRKIARLQSRLYSAAGSGQMRRVPIQHERAGLEGAVIDENGYQWG